MCLLVVLCFRKLILLQFLGLVVRIEQRMFLEAEIEQDINQPSVVSQRCRVKDET